MDRLGKLPFEKMDTELKCIMREYSDELGGGLSSFAFLRMHLMYFRPLLSSISL